MLLLLSEIDTSMIEMTIDRKNLMEKNWNKGVQKYFSNAGRVVQNLRKVKEYVDDEGIP